MNHAARAVAGLLLTCFAPGLYSAESNYPNRPVRFIAPFVPGGPSDILSRLVGAKLSESMGQQFVVDNRGSAGGIVGFELGAKAPPDGYTIMIAAYSGLTINPYVYKKLPYDAQRDFQPITQLTTGGNVFVVHPSVQAKSVKEFIALAKAKPGLINYATTGTGNVLGTALFKSMAGIDMVAIPYKGTGQAVIDLVAGQVQFLIMNPLVAIPNIKGGKLRGLAVTSKTRNPVMPDLPTVDEAGVPGFENVTWHSIVVPAGTSRTIVTRLNTELVKILKLPDVKDRLESQGLQPVGSTPEQLAALIKSESQKYAKLVKDIGYQPQ